MEIFTLINVLETCGPRSVKHNSKNFHQDKEIRRNRSLQIWDRAWQESISFYGWISVRCSKTLFNIYNIHCIKMKFFVKDFFIKCDWKTADLVTFTEENLNKKLHFCAVMFALLRFRRFIQNKSMYCRWSMTSYGTNCNTRAFSLFGFEIQMKRIKFEIKDVS